MVIIALIIYYKIIIVCQNLEKNTLSTIPPCSAHSQGKMSAEAAERVSAAPGGRPSSPVQTSWFEFLLDGSLLETHLHKASPGQCRYEPFGL